MQVNFKESENEIGYSFQKQNDEYYPDKLFETENEIIEMYISKDEKKATENYFGKGIEYVQVLVGKNGCGKSTLIQEIFMMYIEEESATASILIDEDEIELNYRGYTENFESKREYENLKNIIDSKTPDFSKFFKNDYETVKNDFSVEMMFKDDKSKQNFIESIKKRGNLYDILVISKNEYLDLEKENLTANGRKEVIFSEDTFPITDEEKEKKKEEDTFPIIADEEKEKKKEKVNIFADIDNQIFKTKEAIIDDFNQKDIKKGKNNEYTALLKDIKEIKLNYTSISKGEEKLLNLMLNIRQSIEYVKTTYSKIENVVLLLDEPDIHLHPEWCRVFSKELFELLQALGMELDVKFKVIISTHSPFIMSDVPRFCAKKLEKNENGYITVSKPNNTLGLEIPYLLKDEFFLTSGVGELLKSRMKNIYKKYDNGPSEEDKENIEMMEKYVDNLILKNAINGLGLINEGENG